jgi:small subunit ribosomal protein S1
MESNNQKLGNDMEHMPDTEQTTAESQDEMPADETPIEEPEASVTEAPADDTDAEPEEAPAQAEASEEVEEAAVQAEAEPEPAPEAEAEPEPEPEPAPEAEAEPASEVEAEAPTEAEAPADDTDAEPEEAPAQAGASEEVEEAAAQAEAEPEPEPEPEPPKPEPPRFKKGTIVEGTVIETSPTEVLIDLGEDMTGVIASKELERMDREALEALQPGSEVIAFVIKPRGANGQPVLSLARAEEENNWRLAEKHFENQEVYFSQVAGYNKGGLIVRFGKVRGFVPASQISRERQQRAAGGSPEERWGSMVGEDIAVKVVEIDRSRNRLILSERAAARKWREKQKERLLDELVVGEVREGRVISLADFGAFVDLGGADGLVHLTELSWKHVTHPREVLNVGDKVTVQVISVDRDRKRIGLSMKRQEDDPWRGILKKYDVGQLVQATVTKLTKFGAFARLVDDPEIEGLIHISELADYRVGHPRDVVLVGDVLTLRIVKIDPDQRRLGLSLRQVDSDKYMDQDWQSIDLDDEPDTPTIGDIIDYQPGDEDD